MISAEELLLKAFHLDDGTKVLVTDNTSHYFGGFFHVRIKIAAIFPLTQLCFDSQANYADACSRIGETIMFVRTIEKMAVAEADVPEVQSRLIDSFEATMLPYMNRPGFSARFIQREYAKSLKSTVPVYQ